MYLQFACKYVIDDQQNTTFRVERLDGTFLAEQEFSDVTGDVERSSYGGAITQDERDCLDMLWEAFDARDDWSDFTFEIDC